MKKTASQNQPPKAPTAPIRRFSIASLQLSGRRPVVVALAKNS